MKILLILAVVLIGVWLFRLHRRSGHPPSGGHSSEGADKPAAMALDMVRCRQCDLHLPQADAVAGKYGVYCSPEHRLRAES